MKKLLFAVMACALLCVSCHNTCTPTVGDTDTVVTVVDSCDTLNCDSIDNPAEGNPVE